MGPKSDFLLITYSSEIKDGVPLYVSSNCLPVKASKYEPAGHSFHAVALKLRGLDEKEDAETDDRSVSSDDKSQDFSAGSDNFSSKGKKKSGSGSQQDHYALLGLGNLRFLATEDQIRKSYRDQALKHHPDKQAALLLHETTEAGKQAKKDEIESHFKAIQEAYEVLMDPTKRRIFDSTDEFDDDIPTDCAPQDFFKVFGPAFMRNGRWSVTQPIPSLGDDATPVVDVDQFYNFWYNFKSWREFPHEDEYDLEQAESREHKRWMERQNSKIQEKAKKVEYARVRNLVDNAYKKDPRIQRRKEEEKAEKQRRKEAKYMAKKLQDAEAARAAEEEKKRKEEEAKIAAAAALNQKKLKEKEKKLLRKEKSRLRALVAPVVADNHFGLSLDDVETACTSLDMEKLKNLCDSMEDKDTEEKARLLRGALNKEESSSNTSKEPKIHANGVQGSTPKSTVPQGITLSNYEKKERPWGKEEIELLRKAIQKFPKGTSRRWEVVSDFIGTGRSVEEILKAIFLSISWSFSCPLWEDWLLHCSTRTVFLASSEKCKLEIAGLLSLASTQWKRQTSGVYFWTVYLSSYACGPDVLPFGWLQFANKSSFGFRDELLCSITIQLQPWPSWVLFPCITAVTSCLRGVSQILASSVLILEGVYSISSHYLEVHIWDTISVKLSTSTIMHAGKFCLVLGVYSSCEQFVTGSATHLSSQIFELQIPWYISWLLVKPSGAHPNFGGNGGLIMHFTVNNIGLQPTKVLCCSLLIQWPDVLISAWASFYATLQNVELNGFGELNTGTQVV